MKTLMHQSKSTCHQDTPRRHNFIFQHSIKAYHHRLDTYPKVWKGIAQSYAACCCSRWRDGWSISMIILGGQDKSKSTQVKQHIHVDLISPLWKYFFINIDKQPDSLFRKVIHCQNPPLEVEIFDSSGFHTIHTILCSSLPPILPQSSR